jgi:alcohol dehydrogenase (cytochrome c)
MSLTGKSVNYMEGLPYLGEGFEIKPEPGSKGYGELQAIDVNTGKKVWSHWTKMPWNGGVGIIAQPSVFEVDGKEYVAILTGYGGANPIWGGPMAKAAEKVPLGGTLYVFALNHA